MVEQEEVKKEELKEEKKDKSGVDLERELEQREVKIDKSGRKAYDHGSLKTKVLDPENREKSSNLEPVPSSFDVNKKEYVCKHCSRGYSTQRLALACYDRDWEFGRAVKAPRGFKVK